MRPAFVLASEPSLDMQLLLFPKLVIITSLDKDCELEAFSLSQREVTAAVLVSCSLFFSAECLEISSSRAEKCSAMLSNSPRRVLCARTRRRSRSFALLFRLELDQSKAALVLHFERAANLCL